MPTDTPLPGLEAPTEPRIRPEAVGAVCLLQRADDRLTVCGVKAGTVPVCLSAFAPAHVAGWGMLVCPRCRDAAST